MARLARQLGSSKVALTGQQAADRSSKTSLLVRSKLGARRQHSAATCPRPVTKKQLWYRARLQTQQCCSSAARRPGEWLFVTGQVCGVQAPWARALRDLLLRPVQWCCCVTWTAA